MLQPYVDEYINNLAQQESMGIHTNTVMAYRNDLNQLCFYLYQQDVEEWPQVTREHITNYILVMRDTLAYRPATIARKLAAHKSFFRYLQQQGVAINESIEHIEPPRIEKEPPQFLTMEQIQHLFAQVDSTTLAGQRDVAMLRLLVATGVRASEIVSLDLEDVCIQDESVLYVGGSHDQHPGQERRKRTLPLPVTVVEVLLPYLEHTRPLLLRKSEEHALFLNRHGERLTRQGFWLIMKGYARAAHVENITPHMLRHSFAMLMLKEGKELRSVQELLGHAHISTTQTYNQFAHVSRNV